MMTCNLQDAQERFSYDITTKFKAGGPEAMHSIGETEFVASQRDLHEINPLSQGSEGLLKFLFPMCTSDKKT